MASTAWSIYLLECYRPPCYDRLIRQQMDESTVCVLVETFCCFRCGPNLICPPAWLLDVFVATPMYLPPYVLLVEEANLVPEFGVLQPMAIHLMASITLACILHHPPCCGFVRVSCVQRSAIRSSPDTVRRSCCNCGRWLRPVSHVV